MSLFISFEQLFGFLSRLPSYDPDMIRLKPFVTETTIATMLQDHQISGLEAGSTGRRSRLTLFYFISKWTLQFPKDDLCGKYSTICSLRCEPGKTEHAAQTLPIHGRCIAGSKKDLDFS